MLAESERRGDVIDEEELFDLALGVSDESGRMMFHPALFEMAACARTRKNGTFPDRPFFQRVAELAAGKYRDYEFEA